MLGQTVANDRDYALDGFRIAHRSAAKLHDNTASSH
jgi:hypothetical protein